MSELIELSQIDPNPWQTRQGEPDEEYIKNLAYDIAINGLLQVPLGRRVGERVQLAFGHNRLAAYKWLTSEDSQQDEKEGYDLMPVEIRELTDQEMAQAAWSENEKRKDVSSIERALAIQKRMESFGWSQADAANMMGVDRSTISNLLRLLKLPEGLRANIQAGEISERQAMALLPLYEAPEHFHRESYYFDSPEKIVHSAIGGESSDRLRQKVEKYFEFVAKDLQKAEFKLDQLFKETGGVYCGLCRTCDKRMASRNLCFSPDCYDAKTERRRQNYLASASAASGYPVSDPQKGGSVTVPSRGRMETIRATGCPHLCLVYTDGDYFTGYNSEENKAAYGIEKFPHARLVCDKRNNSCSCEKGLNVQAVVKAESKPVIHSPEPVEISSNGHEEVADAEKVAAPTSDELEEAARQARRAKNDAIKRLGEIQEEVEERLVQALREDHPGAFYVVVNHYYWPDERELDMEKIYHKAARDAAGQILPRNYSSMDDLVNKTNGILASLHLDPIHQPKTLVEMFTEQEAQNEMS